MKPILMAGSSIVTMALIAYSIGIISEQLEKLINRKILIFLAIGLAFDISGTTCMIIGSSRSPFTFHGILGYSALMAMLIDNILLWRLWKNKGLGSLVPSAIHKYSRIAYIWWIIAYISGFLMAVFL
jgi:uncharacterized repeat protein (TIGR03987 family)